MLSLLSITELKHSSFFCSFLLSSLCIVGFTNNCMAVLNALCQRLLDYYTSYYCFPVFSVVTHLCLLKNNKYFYPFCTFTSFFYVFFSRQWATDREAGGEGEHAEPGEERHCTSVARFPTGSLQLDPLSAWFYQSFSLHQHSTRGTNRSHRYTSDCNSC